MGPCETCHAGCCRSFAVPLTGADILRIERELRLDFWQFACRWADPHGKIARNHAPHFRFSDDPRTPFVVCLMHAESHFLDGTTKCRFLMECAPDESHSRGVARCGIYGSRPGACRAFPMALDDTGELVVLRDVPPRGRVGHDPAYELCPRPWEPADVDPLFAVQDLVVVAHEMSFFRRLAEVWNRRPQSWLVFPDFLRLVYANRVLRQRGEPVEFDDEFVPAFGSDEESLRSAA
ncbi:MAG TPA: YkgJ family cysteine cluster protein [Planctomycetaceae bacterium]|nr:YkgJ family cysteine cluster protein [Planctomycetaceae bacterium]